MASLLAVLQAERDELRAEESAIISRAETESRRPTDAETERLVAIDERFEGKDGKPGLSKQIALEEHRRERERTTKAVDGAGADEARGDRIPTPFGSLAEQLISVARSSRSGAPIDARLLEIQGAASGLNETVPSEGGFLVQPDYGTELLRDTYDTGILASRTRRRPVQGSGFRGNAVDETSRADGSRLGGLQAYWTGEAESMTATKPKFRKVQLDLEKLTGVYYATDELLADGPALEAEIRDWFVEEFGFKFDDAIIRGTGAGMPLGILNSGALVSQAAEGGQTADTVNATNIQKMFARMPPRSLANAVWTINQEVWPYLFAMEDTEGHRLFLPGGNLSTAPFGTLLGRPIVPTEQNSAIGDVGDVLFVDLNKYLLIEKGGVQADSSIHVQFLTGETAFRFIVRANGQPIPAAAVTPYKGASTLSPFVALAAR